MSTHKQESAPTFSHRLEDHQSVNAESGVVRWYVMVLPTCHRGPANGLQAELNRRLREGEPTFEYFAPRYVEVRTVKGKLVRTERPLLYNYVFLRQSESEIYRLKKQLPQYNFLPRVRNEQGSHYPYISDEAMKNLRWIAKAYSNVIPAYVPAPDKLVKGDRIRITSGQFAGAEASVIVQPGVGQKEVIVSIDDWMWVPLFHVNAGQYELISLNENGKHVYTHLDNDKYFEGLHAAIERFHTGNLTEEDRSLATEAIKKYGNLTMDSHVLRCKLLAILLPAYAILGDETAYNEMLAVAQTLLPLVKAEQSRALLLTTLYGCTDNSLFHEQAHALISLWRNEENPKKAKRQLIRRLDDYDKWLNH